MRDHKSIFVLPLMASMLLFSQASTGAEFIQTIDASQFVPPSPDTAGVTWLQHTTGPNAILASDSEVEEMPIFVGANVFDIDYVIPSLVGTSSTTAYSDEPTGAAYNPANRHLFISDDNQREIFEIDPGMDELYNTPDDIRTSFDTNVLGITDPEGVAYCPNDGKLYIAGGADREVYAVDPGSNGIFDGIDDVVTQFDTDIHGNNDAEGIACDLDHPGHLYVSGEPDDTVFHVTTTGALVRTITVLGSARKLAGLTMAPGSLGGLDPNPAFLNLYITDRGIDNGADPDENDGKIYEYSIEDVAVNVAPVVDAGEDQTITTSTLPALANLDGTATDDGLPAPPALTTTWSQVSGPDTVTFADATAEDTTATLPALGVYVLRLTADDSHLSNVDEVTITVQDPGPIATVYVSTTSTANPPGLTFNDEDIAAYDLNTGNWTLYFDGSDVGLSNDVSAFDVMADGSILLSFYATTMVPDVGVVDHSDIVRFVPTSTGDTTAGTFEWYFDGSDVDLGDTSGERIDAIGIVPDGRLLISTSGNVVVGSISRKDEDMLVFTDTSLGETTSGSWEVYFDGSDVELKASKEDIEGAWVDGVNGDIYLSLLGDFSVASGTVTGDNRDILSCVPGSVGAQTSCTYSLFWDAQALGLTDGGRVDGISLK